MSERVNISVLITCHNRKASTIACLRSLYDQKSLGFEFDLSIFLVDDGSKDGTAEEIRKRFPAVKIIQGSGKLFWNRGMYLAWTVAERESCPDYYLWLNDDVILLKSAVEELLLAADQSQSSIIVGATISRFKNTTTYGGSDKNGNRIEPDGTLQKVQYMNGNIVLVPLRIFESIGNLDPLFDHAIGDYDYGLRAISAGFSIMISKTHLGYCENHEVIPIWCRRDESVFRRILNLYSPLGYSHPLLYSIYVYRHFGIIRSIINFISIHIRVLFPSLWLKN